jgi:hypothetical protein
MRYEFPADYDERECYVVAINASLVPFVAGALRFFEKRGTWSSDADYERGYNAFAEIQKCLMATCLTELIESNNRLYRMLDTALFGTEYGVVTLDPLVVTPELAPTHDLAIINADSLLGRLREQQLLLDNALNGAISPSYARPSGIRDMLQLIIDDLADEEPLDPEMLAKLGEIAVLLA